MKKILFFLVVTATVSCYQQKPGPFFQGNTQSFVYTPTRLTTGLISVSGNIATVHISNGSVLNIQCLTPGNNSGQCFILEAPIVPGQWIWDQYSSEYKPSGFDWNVAYGFNNTNCAAYFVEQDLYGMYFLRRGAVWAIQPNPASWVQSFNSPGTICRMNFPIMGNIFRQTSGYTNTYQASGF